LQLANAASAVTDLTLC